MDKEKTREATKLAMEIERTVKGSQNMHILEERGIQIENIDVGEEERYGAVIREQSTSNRSEGKYIPPARRQREQQQQQLLSKVEDESKNQNESSGNHVENNDHSLERSSSSEELQGLFPPKESSRPSSRGSPRSPLSPLLKQGENPVIAERLRLRLQFVNERFKNTAPVPARGEEDSFPSTPNRSPLLSPLVANARNMNALSLEPSTPNMPEEMIKQFYDFSLNSRKQKEPEKVTVRGKNIEDLKKFSKSLEKKVSPTPDAASTSSGDTTSENNDTTSSLGSISVTTVKESADKGDKASGKSSKLNPNAKVFKPMSATAPSFTPGIAVQPIILPQHIPMEPGQDPQMYLVPPRGVGQFRVEEEYLIGSPFPPGRAPIAYAPHPGYPIAPTMIGTYGQPLRVVPPYVYPNGQQYPYPQPVIYTPTSPQSPTLPASTKRYTPVKAPASPNFVPQPRMSVAMHPGGSPPIGGLAQPTYPGYFQAPNPYAHGQPMPLEGTFQQHPSVYYSERPNSKQIYSPITEVAESKEESGKFQVPNNDIIPQKQ